MKLHWSQFPPFLNDNRHSDLRPLFLMHEPPANLDMVMALGRLRPHHHVPSSKAEAGKAYQLEHSSRSVIVLMVTTSSSFSCFPDQY